MKKIMLTVTLLGFSLSLGANEVEDFFYQRGLEAGYAQGYNKGVEDAFNESKKILAKYKNEIRAYELGKYLTKNGYLTYPKVWQRVDESGNVKIEIQPSRIEKKLNIDDIYAKFNTLPTNPNPELSKSNPLDSKNSVYMSSRDETSFLPSKADANQDVITISIEKSGANEAILKRANLVYSIDENSKKIKVMFFSRTEKDNFCSQYKICE